MDETINQLRSSLTLLEVVKRDKIVVETLTKHQVPMVFKFAVLRGKNLPAKDLNQLSDPYFVLRWCNGEQQKSETVYNNLNPDWNRCYALPVPRHVAANPRSGTLELKVYDEDFFTPDDFIGTVTISLADGLANNRTEQELVLKDECGAGSHGSIFIKFDISDELVNALSDAKTAFTSYVPEKSSPFELSIHTISHAPVGMITLQNPDPTWEEVFQAIQVLTQAPVEWMVLKFGAAHVTDNSNPRITIQNKDEKVQASGIQGKRNTVGFLALIENQPSTLTAVSSL